MRKLGKKEHIQFLDLFIMSYLNWSDGCDISYQTYALITKLDKDFKKEASKFPHKYKGSKK